MKDIDSVFYFSVKPRWLLTIFIALWSLAALILVAILLYGLFLKPNRLLSFIPVLFLLLIASFLGVNYVLWQIKGKEQISISQKGISLKSSNELLKFHSFISFDEFESVEVNNSQNKSFFVRFWGIGGGRILIKYLGRSRKIGQDLSLKESQKICNRLNQLINKNKPVS
jgi:hypothetical protein